MVGAGQPAGRFGIPHLPDLHPDWRRRAGHGQHDVDGTGLVRQKNQHLPPDAQLADRELGQFGRRFVYGVFPRAFRGLDRRCGGGENRCHCRSQGRHELWPLGCVGHCLQLDGVHGHLVLFRREADFRADSRHVVSRDDVRADWPATLCGQYVHHSRRHFCGRECLVGAVFRQHDSRIFRQRGGRHGVCGRVLAACLQTIAERRVFPAIDVKRSGTRKEDMLLSQETLEAIWKVRHVIKGDGLETSEQLVKQLRETKSNADFIRRLSLLD